MPASIATVDVPADQALARDVPNAVFTLENAPVDSVAQIVLLFALFALLLLGAWSGLKAGPMEKMATSMALAIISYSYVLHLFFGRELFLYSQHWHFATVLLLAMLMRHPRSAKLGTYAVAVIALIAALQNSAYILDMLRQIPGMLS